MKILVVSAHPDDESLGAGGSILRHAAAGDEVFWMIVTSVTVEAGYSAQRVKSRQEEIRKAAAMMQMKEIHSLNVHTTRLTGETLVRLIPEISRIVADIKPQRIYLPNRSDIHSDHRMTFNAVMSATKNFRHPYVKQIFMYECLSETDFAPAVHENAFIPNYFVDITGLLEKKQELLRIYESEIGAHPFPRSPESVEALAVLRGAAAGVMHAEAFQLIKYIES